MRGNSHVRFGGAGRRNGAAERRPPRSGPTPTCAARRHQPCGLKGPACDLSQQAAEAEGSPTLKAQGQVGAALLKVGTVRYCQTVRVRLARRRGVRRETSG
jgi:hypothetical protein